MNALYVHSCMQSKLAVLRTAPQQQLQPLSNTTADSERSTQIC